jgi:hypothetical protein
LKKFFANLSVVRPTVMGLAVWLIASAVIGILKWCGASTIVTVKLWSKPEVSVTFDRVYDAIALGFCAFVFMRFIKRSKIEVRDMKKEPGHYYDVGFCWDLFLSTLGAGLTGLITLVGGWFFGLMVANIMIALVAIICTGMAIDIAMPWQKVKQALKRLLTIDHEIEWATARRKAQLLEWEEQNTRVGRMFSQNLEGVSSSDGLLDLTREDDSDPSLLLADDVGLTREDFLPNGPVTRDPDRKK